MTWHLSAHRTAVFFVVVALCVSGCGSSGGRRAAIEVIAPEDKAELTIEDDIDPETTGVQYEVRARTQNIRSGMTMLLVMPGENTTFFTDVDDEGLVVFENATLPPGPHTFNIQNATGSVSSREFSYTLKTLVIETPRDGASIGFGDDSDPEREGLQVNITVKAYAVDGNEDIELSVDGATVGDPVSPNSSGAAVFRGITLSTGIHRLKAVAGNVESSETTVDVNEACASVSFVSPEPGDGDAVRLPGGDRCPGPDEDYVADFVISTDAGDGREVELTVNNTTKLQANVEGSLARFDNVVLNRRMTANEVSVAVMGVNDVTCKPVPYPKDIFVDCAGSDCAIGSPVPYSGDDGDGQAVFYLNESMLNGDGFDIRVDSDVGVLDQQIELIVDGRDGKNVLKADTGPNGNRVSATFTGVKLSAGAHTIEARCRDASGNTTLSGELTWTVDVDACGAEIEAPAADTTVLPGDDLDGDSDDGLQVQLRAAVEGGDCVQSRVAVCNPAEGIGDQDASFTELSGDVIEQEITLQSTPEQALCVETKDRANNLGLSSVTLQYRTEAPTVSIESPADLTVFNATGNDGKTADSNPATTACNADFWVLCTEIGGTVQLRHGDENGPMFASGTCQVRADGDPDLPAGFSGRAKLEDVGFLPGGQDNTTVIATQVISGASHELVGKSEVISLTGWCEPPAVTLFPGCPAEQLELPNGGGNVEVALVQAVYNGTVASLAPGTAELTVTDPDGSIVYTDEESYASGSYRFTNVSLGDAEQVVETRIVLTDGYSNTTTITCETSVVGDLPELQITSPQAGSTLGPNDGCDPGVADKYGVPVTLELDQTDDRELSFRVNDGDLESVPVGDTNLDLCIPVDDGMNTIAFQLDSTAGEGVATPTLEIEADVLSIVEPAADGVLLGSDDFCDPDFGAHVVAEVAPAFEGSAVTVSSASTEATAEVSGGQIDTCVTLPVGASSVTVSLDDTSVSRTVDVSVVTDTPTKSISLSGVTLPDGANYRSGQITLSWSEPEQDYEGQLRSYQLRCGTTAIQASDDDQAKEDWWSAAREVPLAGSVTPPATSAAVGIRIGEQLNCVLRGADAADQLTPIADSFAVSYPFREAKVDVAQQGVRMGYTISAVGDVNDDNINDVLVGGAGRAWLYFGNAGGPTAKSNPNSPDVTFVGPGGSPGFEFGTRVAALGDINGDGEADFAIGHPTYSATAPTAASLAGATYIFYGRKLSDTWPSSVDVSSTNASTCGADVCFIGDTANEAIGFALAPAGDFNGDGRGDIAIGAPLRGTFSGRLYVLLGRAFEGTGGTRPSTFWNINIRLPSGNPLGFYVDGTGPTGTDAARQMGNAVVSVGNVDGATGADLIVNAAGDSTSVPNATSKLYSLSGRAHNGATPNLRAIAVSGLALLDSGPPNVFGVRLSALRNWYDDTQMGVPDVAVFQSGSNAFYVYLGDENGSGQRYANDTRITVSGVNGFSNQGLAASRGYNPNVSSVSRGDIDADGLDDLCIGTATGAGPIYVFYGSSVAENLSSNAISYTSASQINPSARPGTTARTIQPVGDVTGDGEIDLALGEPNANSNTGGLTILY